MRSAVHGLASVSGAERGGRRRPQADVRSIWRRRLGADRAARDGAAGGRRAPLRHRAERPGQDHHRRTARCSRSRSSTCATGSRRSGPSSTRRACSGSRSIRTSPPTASSTSPTAQPTHWQGALGQALLVVAHQRDRGVHGLRRRSERGGRDLGAPDLGDRLAAVQPQRPLDRLRRRTAMLYISTGDGGYANDWGIGHNVPTGNGQDLLICTARSCGSTSTDQRRPDYAIPADNPFVGQDATTLPEIWALRLAQPVALLVRHGRRQPAVLRRRAAEQLRGGRHHREGRQLRLAA